MSATASIPAWGRWSEAPPEYPPVDPRPLLRRVPVNPFAYNDAKRRIAEIRLFTLVQCNDALALDYANRICLQKTARRAIEARIRRLETAP